MPSTTVSDVRVISEIPAPTFIENIYALSDGSLVISIIGRPEIRLVKPDASKTTEPVLITSFPDANACLGLAELSENILAVAVGNMDPTNKPERGSFAIYKVDLNSEPVKCEKIAHLPKVNGVNGIAMLNDDILLLADSWDGNIVALNTKTGTAEVVLEDPTLVADPTAALPIGANGLKIHDGYVYYSNSDKVLVGRVQVDAAGKSTGPFTTIASGSELSVPDDFVIAKDGSMYVAGPLTEPNGDTLQHISLDGKITTIAKGGAVAGATATTWGRTEKDQNVIYLSTMGGFSADGKMEKSAKVTAVTLE